jgi:hypothetical protein
LKSIFVGAWSPSPNFVDNVFNVITNDLVAFFSLAKNGQAPIYVSLATSSGPITLTKNGQAPIFVGLAAYGGPTTLTKNYQTHVFVGLGAPRDLAILAEND